VTRKPAGQLGLFDRDPGNTPPSPPLITDASLSQEAQRRYLHYALSVITSRALPDVRDGLKPVQRRILFTMHHDMHLRPDTKHRKCAAIVGDVMGKYHPHGDSAIYEALVRLAQPFTMRVPLVDGRGNFGSPDGDSAAAMRYTEARLHKVAAELLQELGKQTVDYRPSYDGTRFEPVVVPARFPHLLVNGSQGIAVGMATSIPPHNLGEVIDASVVMIDDPEVSPGALMRCLRGPDFPTGGQLVNTRAEIAEVYKSGQGSLKLRGQWRSEQTKKGGTRLVIYSIPYGIERAAIVSKIAEVIISKKLPALLDVRDESTEETRVVLEINREASPEMVMAYLYKHTPLMTNVRVDLTCLVPIAGKDVAGPARLDLRQIIRHFLDFRFEVVTKRLQFDLNELLKRIHILEGLEKIFDALDETIRIIRKSQGKQDAADKLLKRFSLDEEQVDAILELKLYRLAQLEIEIIRKELKDKRRESERLRALLGSEKARWKLIRAELLEIKSEYADPRRTVINAEVHEPVYDAEAFIIDEDAYVLLTQQGWIKRQRELKDVEATRVREGDRALDVAVGSTKSSVVFFSNQGSCYACRIADITPSTGYGDPVQKLFKLTDGERIVRMFGFDPRMLSVPPPSDGAAEPEEPFAVAVTKSGMSLRFSLRAHRDPSTRSGRKYARLDEGDEVIYVGMCGLEAKVACASAAGRALICEAEEIALLAGPGKGVHLVKLDADDYLVGARVLVNPDDALVVERESGSELSISLRKHELAARATRGFTLFKRGALKRSLVPPPALPQLPQSE
jgi:DNA gyrase subunit A